jgi:hypothetical protein
MKFGDCEYTIDGTGYCTAHELTIANTGFFVHDGATGLPGTPGSDKQAICTQGFHTVPK